ncbi:adenine deaminase [Carboxydothermus pertinax]|uniref:Adenine deaminase n=1 Tax=Carboxydothermus pertinax TaxID=870242 RepID=A0A1L8CST7_9THEO|nr:adenine deaminase [Carboxydothermus pertinax]GAV21924.1 adenine deaminase [Carboxydothermus pertinax]
MDAQTFKTAVIRRKLVDVLMDPDQKATLVLKNGLVINVITREIYQADVAVYDQYILKVGDASDLIGPETEVVDLGGRYYVSPGFIDSHMHFESSMLTISEFSRLSIPTGTTTLVADPHEIGNALGPIGIKAMAEETKVVPNRVYLVVPALTPDCPGLETAGYDITSKDMPEILNYPNVIGIGELQGFSNAKYVYRYTPEVITDLISSTTYAQSIGKMIDGNAPELFGSELAAHLIAAGTEASCHETTRKDECVEKLRYGMYVFMREGSTQKNMAECIRAVTEEGLDSRRLIGATDDMVAEDLAKNGHMNWVVSRIIRQGIDPVEAIQMVTINPATYFGLKHVGVLAPGKMADLVVISDLMEMKIEKVYIGGKLMAEKGRMVVNIPKYTYPEEVKHSVKCKPVTAEVLEVKATGSSAVVRTIGLIPDQNLTDAYEFTVPVSGGAAQADLAQDVLPIAAVERYGRKGSIGRAFVKGFGLKSGAFAESVSHDAHNIIVVGTNYQDMALAVNRVIEMGGGVAVVKNGQVLGDLRLPVGGLITDELDGFELSQKLAALHRLAESELGCTVHAPFMHLSFLALTTSPKWKITDQGLVDVNSFRIIPPVK